MLAIVAVFALLRDSYKADEADYLSVRQYRFYRIEDAAIALREELGREPTVAEIYEATWSGDEEPEEKAAADEAADDVPEDSAKPVTVPDEIDLTGPETVETLTETIDERLEALRVRIEQLTIPGDDPVL